MPEQVPLTMSPEREAELFEHADRRTAVFDDLVDPIAAAFKAELLAERAAHVAMREHRRKWGDPEYWQLRCKEAESQLAATRERLSVVMIKHSLTTGHGDTAEDLLNELDRQLAETREQLNGAFENVSLSGSRD